MSALSFVNDLILSLESGLVNNVDSEDCSSVPSHWLIVDEATPPPIKPQTLFPNARIIVTSPLSSSSSDALWRNCVSKYFRQSIAPPHENGGEEEDISCRDSARVLLRATRSAALRKNVNLEHCGRCARIRAPSTKGVVVLMVGPCGSGKSRLIDALRDECCRCDRPPATGPSWDPARAVVSHFGEDPAEACNWLGHVGLNSVPSWTKPYHILSTGERFRADCAREIRAATKEEEGAQFVFLDDFTSSLDRQTGSCCAASVARLLRRVAASAFIASSNSDVTSWLQPDVVVTVASAKEIAVRYNTNAAKAPRIRMRAVMADFEQPPWRPPRRDDVDEIMSLATGRTIAANCRADTDDDDVPGRPAQKKWQQPTPRKRRRTPVVTRSVSCAERAGHAVSENETRPGGGTVLLTNVLIDAFTKACDALFDSKFDGRSMLRVPDFPAMSDLLRARPCSETVATVGYICGPSGTAKSVMLRHYFGPATRVVWRASDAVGAHFADEGDFDERLQAVGLAEDIRRRLVSLPVPREGRLGDALSSGELSRLELARLLGVATGAERLDPPPSSSSQQMAGALAPIIVVVDEFTSSLDRKTAVAVANGVRRYLSSHPTASGRVSYVFAGCHSDVIGPGRLEPNWVYNTASRMCYWCDFREEDAESQPPRPPEQQEVEGDGDWSVSARPPPLADDDDGDESVAVTVPEVSLRLKPCEPCLWQRFRHHHYKTETLSTQARTFVVLADTAVSSSSHGESRFVPVGFVATIRHNGRRHARTDALPRRAHRTVVLPQFQGIGVGSRLSDAVAEVHRREGSAYFGQTVHPSFGGYRDRSPLWRGTQWNHLVRRYRIENWKQRRDDVRIRLQVPKRAFSHAYAQPAFEDQCAPAENTGPMLSSEAVRRLLLARGVALFETEAQLSADDARSQRGATLQPHRQEGEDAGALCTGACPSERSLGDAAAVDFGGMFESLLATWLPALSAPGQVLRDRTAEIQGYVWHRRDFSPRLVFLDIGPTPSPPPSPPSAETGDGASCRPASCRPWPLQCVLNAKYCNDSPARFLRRVLAAGDRVWFAGPPGRTRTGCGRHGGFAIFPVSARALRFRLDPERLVRLLSSTEEGDDERIEAMLRRCEGATSVLRASLKHQLEQRASGVARSVAGQLGGEQKDAPGDDDVLRVFETIAVDDGGSSSSRVEALRGLASRRQRGLYVVLENPAFQCNVAGIMRSCDAFGVTQLLIISDDGEPVCDTGAPEMLRLSVSANLWVETRSFPDTAACSAYLRQRGCGPKQCFGTAVHSKRSRSLYDSDLVVGGGDEHGGSIAIWFGNESRGLSTAAHDACDNHVYLPMLGMVESLNLSVCCGAVLSEVCRQRSTSGRDFALAAEDQDRIVEELVARARGF